MNTDGNKILDKMLDRLFAALATGPSLNCKPHSSRQRIDLVQFAKLQDVSPEDLLRSLLGETRVARAVARVAPPAKRDKSINYDEEPEEDPAQQLTDDEKTAQIAWRDQQSLIGKLRSITEDSRTYENDTGVHVLHIGFPLLSLPPGTFGLQRNFTRRILAPIAFVSVVLSLKGGSSPTIMFDCKNEGVDTVVPNSALLAWLEQQTGKNTADLFNDSNLAPWEEIAGIVQQMSRLMDLEVSPLFADAKTLCDQLKLEPAPRSEETQAKPTIIPSAILGLFPMSNQGLLRDMQAMAGGEEISGPIQSFVNIDSRLLETPVQAEIPDAPVLKRSQVFREQRLIAAADPCQARAVTLSRTSRGLVIHGPPGTGKSQTITNIVGDHLCRRQRVLLVCDKRTALDVVKNRLDALGLGHLCAVIHDSQRDQRDLYKSIREQLDALPDARTNSSAETELAKVDAELERLHNTLTDYHIALMQENTGGISFHKLMGQWLAIPSSDVPFKESTLAGTSTDALEEHTQPLSEILQRAQTVTYQNNPCAESAGMKLTDFLATPLNQFSQTANALGDAAAALDATADPSIPAFSTDFDLATQGRKREEIARPLKQLLAGIESSQLLNSIGKDIKILQQKKQTITDVSSLLEIFRAGPLDTELALVIRAQVPQISDLAMEVATLDQYLKIAAKWYSFFCFSKKSAAGKVAAKYALQLNIENAGRLEKFLIGLRTRLLLQTFYYDLIQQPPVVGLISDELLDSVFTNHAVLYETLIRLLSEPELSILLPAIKSAFADPANSVQLTDGLSKSPARANALEQFENHLTKCNLFNHPWLSRFFAALRQGGIAYETIASLIERQNTVEGILRVSEGLDALPAPLRSGAALLIREGVDPDSAFSILKKSVLSLQIIERLKGDASLGGMDAQKLRSSFDRYRVLERNKRVLVRDTILHLWGSRQKQKLLAVTGSRLNSQGADIRRRLTIRGQQAMRIRQVVAVGNEIEGGDPLFDLRPVWMASPETVAQIFPRKPQFEMVIFDEASQCRLEEALPVLTRANRVVVAGDLKQLPPTRFFESSVAVSQDEQLETDQDLFEAQQGEIEDLLGAALNVEIEECYLDVHYRSHNSDLIQFSNKHFYNSRLQAIPGHPANRSRFAPLTLYKTGGVYDKHCNEAEADLVCKIVGDLLKRSEPPSIGIACINVQQRNLIVEKLDTLAADDHEFGRRLADARTRRGAASFEGLFVRNLENVQGDERDHMIISTTYGPDPAGKFYRRFGPLGRAGGGRRLNVLVTRAREEVHLVTSIPTSVYRALPAIPPGAAPGGAWLLFSYLSYAEELAGMYETNHQILSQQIEQGIKATVNVRPTRWPSQFSQELGNHLANSHNVGGDVHWGNDGFCVDLALHHPTRLEDVTIGILCDLTRFAQAEDPVEWEIFRTGILEAQGWQLHRIFTPHYFRDGLGSTRTILDEVKELLANEQEKDAIRVVDSSPE